MDGWIKLHRKMLQWEWFDKEGMLVLFIYLLLKANTEAKRWRGITIQRGQLVTSVATITKDLKCSTQQARTRLNRLISTNEITIKTTSQYSIITICNFDSYQANEIAANNQDDKQPDNPTTNDQQTDNKPLTNDQQQLKNKKNKRIKEPQNKEREGDTPSPVGTEPTASVPDKAENIPFADIKNQWNEICTGYAKIFTFSESRKNKIRIRISEMGGLEKALPIIRKLFEKLQSSKFLRGDNKRGWKASFDWLFENDKNWVKVWEGNYDDYQPAPKANGGVNDYWTN